MSKTTVKKIGFLEAQLQVLKRSMLGKPFANDDGENWQKVRKDVKRSRKAAYRRRYGKG